MWIFSGTVPVPPVVTDPGPIIVAIIGAIGLIGAALVTARRPTQPSPPPPVDEDTDDLVDASQNDRLRVLEENVATLFGDVSSLRARVDRHVDDHGGS